MINIKLNTRLPIECHIVMTLAGMDETLDSLECDMDEIVTLCNWWVKMPWKWGVQNSDHFYPSHH
jgi:hypothetical protein